MKLGQIEQTSSITKKPQKFDKLLKWLDEDRETAGRKYQSIHQRLIKIFAARGSHISEELADETIERITRKIDTLTENYVGDPSLYFYGVAKKVFLEFTRKPILKELPITLSQQEYSNELLEQQDRCLEKCLKKLSPKQAEFIIEYYKKDKKDKIENRKRMAEELGITEYALRVRAFRIRKVLQEHFFSSANKEDMILELTDNQYNELAYING